MSFNVNKLDVVFFQRDRNNSVYEQVNISGSSAIFYLDENGVLTAGSMADLLKTGGTTRASLQSYSRPAIAGETLYSVDTVNVGLPNRLVRYEADPNNPLAYKVTYTQTWTKDTPDGIGIGKTDEEPYVNATLDVSGTVIITGSLTVTGFIYGSASYALTASHVEGASFESASYSDYALTASYVSGSSDSSVSSSYSLSSSYSDNSLSSSIAIVATAADFALLAGDSITSTSASYALTASYVSGSALSSESASYAKSSSWMDFNGNRAIKRQDPDFVGINVGGMSVIDFLENFFFPFVPATLSINSSTLNYETGSSQNITINGSIVPNDETIFDSGSVKKTGGLQVSTFPTSSYSVSDLGVTASYVYRSYFRVGNDGSPGNIQSTTKTVNFNYPVLYGTSSVAGMSGTTLYSALLRDFTGTTYSNKTYSMIGLATYVYFAYPATWPDLVLIRDPNDFNMNASFELSSSVPVTSSGLFKNWNLIYKVYRLKLLADPNGNFDFNWT